MKKLFALMILAPAFLLVWTANVLAQEVTFCPPDLFNMTVDKVVVGPGECIIFNSTIKNGGVQAQSPAATLILVDSIVLNGDVQAIDTTRVFMNGTTVHNGDVIVQDVKENAIIINNTILSGNIQVEGARGDQETAVSSNTVASGNIQITANREVRVSSNEIFLGNL